MPVLMKTFIIMKGCVTLIPHLSRLLRDHRFIMLQLVSLRGLSLCSREEGFDRVNIAVGAIVGPGALRMTIKLLIVAECEVDGLHAGSGGIDGQASDDVMCSRPWQP